MRLRAVIGSVGVGATLVGVLALLSPEAVLGTSLLRGLAQTVAGLDVGTLSLGGVGLVTLAALVSTLISTDDRLVAGDARAATRFERTLDRSRESAAEVGPRTASDLDQVVDRAVAGDDDAMERVRAHLTALVERALETPGRDEPATDAAGAIATGDWTDDSTAAAFLADPAGPDHSIRSRIRLWLDPETERERRIRRTVAQIEQLDGEDR